MGFERIRMLRHLFGGMAGHALPGQEGNPTARAEVELRSLLADLQEHEMSDWPLGELPMAVIDTETTGFDPAADVLLSIAATTGKPEEACDAFHTFVRLPAGRVIPEVVRDLTGITEGDLQDAPQAADALQAFLQFVGDRVLVAHHAGHDIRFLNAALRRAWGVELNHHVLDTGKIAMLLHSMKKYPTLDMLLALYDVPCRERHTASGDALMTGVVLQRQLELLTVGRILTLGQLWEKLIVLEHAMQN